MTLKLALIVCLTTVAAFSAADLTYHLTDLGAVGSNISYATAVNNSGQVVGTFEADGDADWAFLYSNGCTYFLGTFGGDASEATAINAFGQVAGCAEVTGDAGYHAFLYSGGTMTDLEVLPNTYSQAAGLNDAGQIVGLTYGTTSVGFHAFLYSDGGMVDLGTLGGSISEACGINESGQVVGCSYTAAGDLHAFLDSDSSMVDLGTLGGTSSSAYGINASGQVVGCSTFAPDSYESHAFLYSGGNMIDLGTLGGTGSSANSINASGQIVGAAYTRAQTQDAFLWSDGVMHDLNALMDPCGSGYTVIAATCIADDGIIAGQAVTPNSELHAVVLTPNAGIKGSVCLQDYVGHIAGVPIRVEFRNPGTTTVVQWQTTTLKADGSFTCPTTLKGTYDVAAKASHWLRKTMAGVNLTGDSFVFGVNFSLVNGDVGGHNNVDLLDLAAILRAWRTSPGSPHWNPNADVNGDGVVNMEDWMIVAKNWRKSGDP